MSNEVARTKTLEERITERLHEQIGDLVTAEDLKAMVARGVEKALFQERPDPRNSTSYSKVTKPALVDELVEKHLAGKMADAVNAWIAENPEKMQEAVDRAIRAGVADALIRTLDNRFAGIFHAGVEQMRFQGILPPAPNV